MADDARISPYNVADCKNTTDDALQNYLTSIKFRPSHFYTDVKLALGYAAVIVSAITFAYDYKLGFDATKHYTIGTVILYMLLNGAFSYWLWFVEKDIIFAGSYQGRRVEISTAAKKYDPTYHLTFRYASTAASSRDMTEVAVTSEFMQWFTADGFFVAKPFQEWIASSIPLIGEADPTSAISDAKFDTVEQDKFEPQAVTADISESKAGASQRRKKA